MADMRHYIEVARTRAEYVQNNELLRALVRAVQLCRREVHVTVDGKEIVLWAVWQDSPAKSGKGR